MPVCGPAARQRRRKTSKEKGGDIPGFPPHCRRTDSAAVGKELRQMLDDAGLKNPSGHYLLPDLLKDLNSKIAFTNGRRTRSGRLSDEISRALPASEYQGFQERLYPNTKLAETGDGAPVPTELGRGPRPRAPIGNRPDTSKLAHKIQSQHRKENLKYFLPQQSKPLSSTSVHPKTLSPVQPTLRPC